jgi:hypothetical protein
VPFRGVCTIHEHREKLLENVRLRPSHKTVDHRAPCVR